MNRIAQLDGLRFFAVLSVMIGHWLQWQWSNPFLLRVPFSHGVTLFFVLSGYLITGILIRSKEKILLKSTKKWQIIKHFYVRRFLRIFPIYYLLILFLVFLDYQNIRDVLFYLLTYTTNVYISITRETIGHFTHLWSLAVEEQFYLIWPFIVLFTQVKTFRKITVSLVALSILFKAFCWYEYGNWLAAGYSTFGCMHALVLGALLADLKINESKIIPKLSHPLIMNGLIIGYSVSLLIPALHAIEWYRVILEEFIFAIVSCFMILRASEGQIKGVTKYILENKFIQYTGKISYGMYLYHAFMPSLFAYLPTDYINNFATNKFGAFLILFTMAFILSHISWHLIESPINRLKKKFPYVNPEIK